MLFRSGWLSYRCPSAVLLHSWRCSFVKKENWKDLACRNDGCRSSAKETAIGARRFVHNELLSINGWMRVCEQRLTTRVEGIADGGARVNCTHSDPQAYCGSASAPQSQGCLPAGLPFLGDVALQRVCHFLSRVSRSSGPELR